MSPYLSYGIVFVATLRFFGTPKLKPSRVIRKFANPNFVVFEFYNFEVPKNVKLRRKQFHMKDTGKPSSRKLRRVVYYLLYRMDPQKTHYKISFSAKMSKIENSFFFLYISPLTPDQTPL